MKTFHTSHAATLSRRGLLRQCVLGAGALSLRALATGVPASILTDPLRARAEEPARARILILSTSYQGEPLNANAPGMYEPGLEGVMHPQSATMAPTPVQLGDRTYLAAKPWAELPASLLARTAFLHHGTYTGIHARQPQMMKLMGLTARQEMLVSIIAKHNAPLLGTTRVEPVSLGATAPELLSYEGRILSNVAPTSLAMVLGGGGGPLANLQKLRDRNLDRLHALYKEQGTAEQRRMLDRFAQSRKEARNISDALLSRLSAIVGNDAANQVLAASVLAAIGVSPVITVHIPFGGDNHADEELDDEASQTVSGVAQLGGLAQSLEMLRGEGALKHDYVIAAMGVFGRSLALANRGRTGRDHNPLHHVTVLMGDGIRAGVAGGCEPSGRDYGAMAIDPSSGRGVPSASAGAGVVPFEETLAAVGKTLAVAAGLPREVVAEQVLGGKVLESALV